MTYVADWIREGRPDRNSSTDTYQRAEAWSVERGLHQLRTRCVCTLRRGPGGGRRRCPDWRNGCPHHRDLWGGWGDHGTTWKNAATGGLAFVGQPYGDRDGLGPESMLAPARAFAETEGCELVVDPGQSWWYPGATTAVIVCEKQIAHLFAPVSKEIAARAIEAARERQIVREHLDAERAAKRERLRERIAQRANGVAG